MDRRQGTAISGQWTVDRDGWKLRFLRIIEIIDAFDSIKFFQMKISEGNPPKLPICKCSSKAIVLLSYFLFKSSNFFAGPIPTGKITASYSFLKVSKLGKTL